jgi:hypothetical protein
MNTARVALVGLLLAVAFSGCSENEVPPPERCALRNDAGLFDLPDGGQSELYVEGPFIDLQGGGGRPEDGGTVVPLRISAYVPCLMGGLTSTATTSVGTIGGVGPGAKATVFLSPTETDLLIGRVAGEVDLFLPTGREGRVQADVLENSKAYRFSVQEDGGITRIE